MKIIYIESIHPTYNIPYWYCPTTQHSSWTVPVPKNIDDEIIILNSKDIEKTITVQSHRPIISNSSNTYEQQQKHQEHQNQNNTINNSLATPTTTVENTNNKTNSQNNHSLPNININQLPTIPEQSKSLSSSPIIPSNNHNNHHQHTNNVVNNWTLLPSSTLKPQSVSTTSTSSSSSSHGNNNNTEYLDSSSTYNITNPPLIMDGTNILDSELQQQLYGWNDIIAETALIPDNDPHLLSSSPLEGVAAALMTASTGNNKAFNTVKKVLSRLAYHPEIGTPERTAVFFNPYNSNNNTNSGNTPQPSLNGSPASPIDTKDTTNTSNTTTNGRLSAIAVYDMMEQFLPPFEPDDIKLLTKLANTNIKSLPKNININNQINNHPVPNEIINNIGNANTPTKDTIVTTPSQKPINQSNELPKSSTPLSLSSSSTLPADCVRALTALTNPSIDGYSFIKRPSSTVSKTTSNISLSPNIHSNSPVTNMDSITPSRLSTVPYPIPVRSLGGFENKEKSSKNTIFSQTESRSSSISIPLAPSYTNDRSNSISSNITYMTNTTIKDNIITNPTTTALQNSFRTVDYETNPIMKVPLEEQNDIIKAIQHEIREERNYNHYQLLQAQSTTNNNISHSSPTFTVPALGLAFQDHSDTTVPSTTLLPFNPNTQSAIPISLSLLHKHATDPNPLEITLQDIKKPINNDFPLLSIAPHLASQMNSTPSVLIPNNTTNKASPIASGLSPNSNRFHIQSNNYSSAFSPPRSPVNGQSMNNSSSSNSKLPRSASGSRLSVASAPAPSSPTSVLSDSFPITTVFEMPTEGMKQVNSLLTSSFSLSQDMKIGPLIIPLPSETESNSNLNTTTTFPSTNNRSKSMNYTQAYLSSTPYISPPQAPPLLNQRTFDYKNILILSDDNTQQPRPQTPPFPPVVLGTTLMDATTDKLLSRKINPLLLSSSKPMNATIIQEATNLLDNYQRNNTETDYKSNNSEIPFPTDMYTNNNQNSNILDIPYIPSTISPLDSHLLPPNSITGEDNNNNNSNQAPNFITTNNNYTSTSSSTKNELLMNVLDAIIDVQQQTPLHTIPFSSLGNFQHTRNSSSNNNSSNSNNVTTLYTKQMPKVPVMTQLLARIALG